MLILLKADINARVAKKRGDWAPPKSAAQADAGTYKKPIVRWRGLVIRVENPAGTVRRGSDWAILMDYDYGYVSRTEGLDGDEVDVYLGPSLEFAPMVYVVHQRKRGADDALTWLEPDEDKCMLGFLSEQQAVAAYLDHYTDPRFLGPVTAMTVDAFVEKVKATRERPQMIKALVREYTKQDGTHVAQHERKPMYVSRKVLNGQDLHDWAQRAGFKNVVPADKMHVTVAYSKAPVHHGSVGPHQETVTAQAKHVGRLGDGTDHVLHVDHPKLQERFKHMLGLGASWDHDTSNYQPHVTISYKPQERDFTGIDPFKGDVVLGPEVIDDLKTGWGQKVTEEAAAPATDFEDDMTRQAAWLDEQARGHGFKGVEDLLANDPAMFGELAAAWRDEHPALAKALDLLAGRRAPTMLFLKARDRRDTTTPDLFGTHLEHHVRKDGVVQGYHVKPSASVHDRPALLISAPASKNAKPDVSNLINNATVNPKGAAVEEKVQEPEAFNPEAYIKIAADDASKLRADDVFRLFEELPREGRNSNALQSYLYNARPDLESVVQDAIDATSPVQEFKRANKRDVPDWLVEAVEAKIEKANRRAKKLGVDGFKLIHGEPYQKRVSDEHEWPERFVTMIPLTVEGPVIKVPGWSLQGRVDFEDGGILVNARPGTALPPRFRSIKPICDHCKSDRQRNAVFVFQAEGDGHYMQVGRQCLRDFMGVSPEAALWAASEFGGIFDDIDEELQRGGGSAGHETVSLSDVMAAAACAVRLGGFFSRKAADEKGGVPTSSAVHEILFPPKILARGQERPPKPEDVDKEKAQKVIEWVQSTWGAKEDPSDYEYNAVELTSREAVRPKRIGLLTSLIAAYDRAMGEQVERAKRVNAHVGEVGQRRDFVLTYSGETWFDTSFGSMVIGRFETPEGLVVYKGGTPFWSDEIKAGDELKITGTIKAHDDYKGTKQTLISRCVPTKEKPVKGQKKKKEKPSYEGATPEWKAMAGVE